jgi:uncharacterized LabA/DUF88 family protein
MGKTVLYIDGENLRHYVENVLTGRGIIKSKASILNLNLELLFKKALKGIRISQKIYYASKLRFHKETPRKSQQLIQEQRVLKTRLEKTGFKFIISGNVRAQIVRTNKRPRVVFKEKGVDVKIAVDLVSAACDKKTETIILCSSDSDLQPAVKEVKRRGAEIIYLGFEISPNKGLMYTTDRTILIRNSEILDCLRG